MSIPFPSGYTRSLVPAIAIAVRLGVGAIPASADYSVVLLGNKTSAGIATAATVVEVSGPDDANTQSGARSELAHMARAWFKIAPRGRVSICAVAEGDTPTAATCTLLFATTASAAGVVRIRIGGRQMPEVSIASGATASTVAAAVEAMLDLYTDLPCTAGSSTATVTLTAAQAGPRGNDLRVVCEIVPAGSTAVGMTVALNGGSGATKVDGRFGTGTATAGAVADDFTAALAAIYAARFDFVVVACNDDTNRALVSAHVTAASGIAEGRRRAAFAGSIESTLATVRADAQAANNPRFEIKHLKGAHNTTGEIAAAYAAAHIYGDGSILGISQYLATKQNALQLAPAIAAPELSDYLTSTEIAANLAAGVTVLGASRSRPGYAEVVRPVTTRTLAVSGATSYAVIDPSKVRVADEVADRIETFAATNYADKNLTANPSDPDNAPSSPYVIWPDAIEADLLGILRGMEDEGLLQSVNTHAAEVAVAIDSNDNTVAVAAVPIEVIPHFHSFVVAVDQVG